MRLKWLLRSALTLVTVHGLVMLGPGSRHISHLSSNNIAVRDASSTSFAVSTGTTSKLATTSSNTAGSAAASRTLDDGAPTPSSNSAFFSTSFTVVSTSAAVASATASQDNGGENEDVLPLKPILSPVFGLAGAILILTGLVYLLIGIKNKWIQIFLSAAYLSSLAVTVLILYVVNPPISLGVQGAYFVAAFIPALLLGAGALTFTDVTEGLGCLLGGFCISMWFLVLKPGGLITSTTGKAVFIGLSMLGVFLLSFSQYSRSYALIGSTSFGGATIFVLGTDCFSCAGLKEFWVYIWALNNNIFPLLTTTYPVTRGIRVEIAAIVVLTIFGVLSQIRIWRIIQDQKRAKAQAAAEVERQKEQVEEDLGRRLEAENEVEREQWEAVYGNKDRAARTQADSGVGTDPSSATGSIRKVSACAGRAEQGHAMERDQLQDQSLEARVQSGDFLRPPQIGLQAAPDNAWELYTAAANWAESGNHSSGPKVHAEPESKRAVTSVDKERTNGSPPPTDAVARVQGETASKSPEMMAVPYHVPPIEDKDDDRSSAATVASTHYYPHPKLLHRLSGSSFLKSSSGQSPRKAIHKPSSSEDLIETRSRDDGRSTTTSLDVLSSRAPHILELPDTRLIDSNEMLRHSVVDNQGFFDDLATHDMPNVTKTRKGDPGPERNKILNTYIGREAQTSATLVTKGLKAATAPTSDGLPKNPEYLEAAQNAAQPATHESEQGAPTAVSGGLSESPVGSGLKDLLPTSQSKVVVAFRTNEWAKYLDGAEKPEIDKIIMPEVEREEIVEKTDEPVAHLDTEAIKESPLVAQQPSTSSPDLTRSSSTEHWSVQQVEAKDDVGDSNSLPTLQSFPRRPLSLLGTIGIRSSSHVVASPINEDAETTTFIPRPTPSPLPSNTLMAQRQSILQGRNDSFGSAYQSNSSSTASFLNPGSPPMHEQPNAVLSNDDLSLSQRKLLLQQSSQSSSSTPYLLSQSSIHPAYRQSQPALTGVHPAHRSMTDPSLRRTPMLAAFRSSLQQEAAQSQLELAQTEVRRKEMWDERQREALKLQRKGIERRRSDGVFDAAMRRTDMQEAHREVLRKMQAGANAKLLETDR